MNLKKAISPFNMATRLHLCQLTGVVARTLKEFCKGIETLPGSVIYHHTHHFLQQHQYLTPEPPNDFAYWIGENLGEHRLSEELLAIPIHEFTSIRELRMKIVKVLKKHLAAHKVDHRVMDGDEFHFIKSVSFIFPTKKKIWTMQELVDQLRLVTVDSLYFHFFEARLRLERGTNDFSDWLDKSLAETELARTLDRLDPYSFTIEGLRAKLIRTVEARVQEIRMA